MRKIRIGEGYALTKCKPKRLYRYISLFAVLTSMCLYARAQEDIEWTPAASGQSAPTAKGLQVGDTVPDELWHKPLTLWMAANNKTKAVTLSDYRGKVIVLDFWSTHCTTCIYNMPKLMDLEASMSTKVQVLPVTMEEEDVVSSFFERTTYKPLIGLPVSSLVGDQVLFDTFPSESLPHLVVLDTSGRVAAITLAEFLDVPKLESVFLGTPVYIPRARKHLSLPVLKLSDQYAQTNRLKGTLYYSTLSGYLDAVGHQMSWSVNHAAKSRRYYVSNTTVDKLYATALSSPLPITPKRRILDVQNPSAYVFDVNKLYDLDFRKAHLFTYEIIAPDYLERAEIKEKMLLDLNFMLGLNGNIQQRPIECWVLKAVNGKPIEKGNDLTLNQLVIGMNNDPKLPFVINEAGRPHQNTIINKPLPFGLTLAEYNNLLAPFGLRMVAEARTIEMFVLTETHDD